MNKALLVGNNDNITQEVASALAAQCLIGRCPPAADAVSAELGRGKTDLVIGLLCDELTAEELFFILTDQFPEMPVVAVGTEEEREFLEDTGCLPSEHVRFLTRPVELEDVKNATAEMLSRIEGDKAAEQRKKRRGEERREERSANSANSSSASKTTVGEAKENPYITGNSRAEARAEGKDGAILIVDDSPQVLRAMNSILSRKYKVAFATSGAKAIETALTDPPDVILLDYEMPEMDGVETLKMLRSSNTTKDIPVIFLTGIADFNHVFDALEMRPQGYLLKPCTEERLFSEIRKVLAEK